VLAIAATRDAYQILNSIGSTNGYITTTIEEIVSSLHRWESRFRFRIVGIGHQFIILDIVSGNIDYNLLAKEIYAICPDVVNLGTHSVAKLAEQIRAKKCIYMWWTYDYGFLK
jgi:hypothetical protein